MMIDPAQLLIKTAANYISFKIVKGSIDYVWNREQNIDQTFKTVECPICLHVWRGAPDKCPFCSSSVINKLYKEWERYEDDGFGLDNNLTVKGRK